MALTEKQLEATQHLNGILQLISCAGSGKTEVVAQLIANLLAKKSGESHAAVPANVVAFTFTEKAAAELKQRITDRTLELTPDIIGLAEMFVGTIHGFCWRNST